MQAHYDAVVVGGGLAGWVAATEAAEAGLRVLVVDTSPVSPGQGNSVASGGVLHACHQDPATDPDRLYRSVMEVTDGEADAGVARAWATTVNDAVGWVKARGGQLAPAPSAFFHPAQVFLPIRETVPGLDGSGGGLHTFLLALAHTVTAKGGTVWQPARAVALQREGAGWLLDVDTHGQRRGVSAPRVVLADGGFQANPELVGKYLGTNDVLLRATVGGQGDGLRMGLAAGGVAVQMRSFYGHLLSKDALHNAALWPYPVLDGLCSAGILVSRDGQRFVDERLGGVTAANNVAWSSDPLGNWVVFDADAWEGVGTFGTTPPNPHLEHHGATVVVADTLAHLAVAAGMDVERLRLAAASVESPPRRPPFRAIPVVAGVTFTMGGLRVNSHAEVVGASDAPLGGLYAAGGTMGGLHGGPRAGYAGGLLEALTFGLLAGRHMAAASR